MTPEQKAVIDAAKEWDNGTETMEHCKTALDESLIRKMLENGDMVDDVDWAKEFWIANSGVKEDASGWPDQMSEYWEEAVESLGADAPSAWTGRIASKDAHPGRVILTGSNQATDGRLDVTGRYRQLETWRKLRVTYTPMGEQSPAERIAELERDNRIANGRITDARTVFGSYVETSNARIAILEKETDVLLALNSEQRARIARMEQRCEEWAGDYGRQNERVAALIDEKLVLAAELGKLRPVFEQAARMVHVKGLFQGGFGGTVAVQIADLILDAQDDSALLWGVLDSDPPNDVAPFVMHCRSEQSARNMASKYERRRVVRLRVIEVPE